MGIIEQMLAKYFISCKEDVYNAMREVCQQITLIKNPEELKIWDKDYFKFLVSNISYQQDEVIIKESLEQVMAKTQEKYGRKEKSQSSTDMQDTNVLKNDKSKPSRPKI